MEGRGWVDGGGGEVVVVVGSGVEGGVVILGREAGVVAHVGIVVEGLGGGAVAVGIVGFVGVGEGVEGRHGW